LSLTPTKRLKTMARWPPSTLYKLLNAAYNPTPPINANLANVPAGPEAWGNLTFRISFRFIFTHLLRQSVSEWVVKPLCFKLQILQMLSWVSPAIWSIACNTDRAPQSQRHTGETDGQTQRHEKVRECVFGLSLESEARSGTFLGLGFSPTFGGYLILSITACSGSESEDLENWQFA
jgi:hypothetical protein